MTNEAIDEDHDGRRSRVWPAERRDSHARVRGSQHVSNAHTEGGQAVVERLDPRSNRETLV